MEREEDERVTARRRGGLSRLGECAWQRPVSSSSLPREISFPRPHAQFTTNCSKRGNQEPVQRPHVAAKKKSSVSPNVLVDRPLSCRVRKKFRTLHCYRGRRRPAQYEKAHVCYIHPIQSYWRDCSSLYYLGLHHAQHHFNSMTLLVIKNDR
jgi:hypothetical protein